MTPREITPFQFLGNKPGRGGRTQNPDHIVTTFDVSKEEIERSAALHPSASGATGDLAGTANVGNVPEVIVHDHNVQDNDGEVVETVAVREATAMEVDQTEAKADAAAAVENADVVVVLPPDTTPKAPKGAPKPQR